MAVATPPISPALAIDEQVASLQATLGRLEHALGVTSEAIVWTDEDGNIRWCNSAFERLSMLRALSLSGQPIEHALALEWHDGPVDVLSRPLRRALSGDGENGGRVVIDTYQTNRGGQRRFLEIHAASLSAASGTSAIMVVRDNTERHLAETWLEAKSHRSGLLRAVAAASNQAEEPEQALKRGLQLICQFLGWPLGHAILIGPGEAPGAELWFPQEPSQSGLTSRGLTAEAIKTAKPAWTIRPEASPSGLECSLALPVKSLGQNWAVLEFFTSSAVEPDPELIPLFEQIGAQLGCVF